MSSFRSRGPGLASPSPCPGPFSFQARKRHRPEARLLPELPPGGYDPKDNGILTSAELYDPRSHGWCPAGNLAVDRYEHTATLLPDGRVLVAAGFSNHNQASAELYVP